MTEEYYFDLDVCKFVNDSGIHLESGVCIAKDEESVPRGPAREVCGGGLAASRCTDDVAGEQR